MDTSGNKHAYFLYLVQMTSANEEIIEFYEKNKPDINHVIKGDCAVLAAARRNNAALLEFLAENGASMTVKDSKGLSLMDWAEYHENEKMKEIIAAHMPTPRTLPYKG